MALRLLAKLVLVPSHPIVGILSLCTDQPSPLPMLVHDQRAPGPPRTRGSAPARAAGPQVSSLRPSPIVGSPLSPIPSRCLGHIERYLIAQDVVRRARQLVRHCLDPHDLIRRACLH